MCSCLELHSSDCAVKILLLVLTCYNVKYIHKARAQSQEQFRPNALFKANNDDRFRKDIEITTQTMELQMDIMYKYVNRLSVHHFINQPSHIFNKITYYEYKIHK